MSKEAILKCNRYRPLKQYRYPNCKSHFWQNVNNIAQDYKIGNTRIVIATDDIVSPKEQKAIRERLGEIWYEAEHRSEIEAERTRFEKLFEV